MDQEDDKVTALKCLAEAEMDIKNRLYAFILEQGKFFELREFELSHDMSSVDCHTIDTDPLKKVQEQFEAERNIKNNLFAFILKHGLFDRLKRYSCIHCFETPEARIDALKDDIMKIYLNIHASNYPGKN